jgi:hypothetical protein
MFVVRYPTWLHKIRITGSPWTGHGCIGRRARNVASSNVCCRGHSGARTGLKCLDFGASTTHCPASPAPGPFPKLIADLLLRVHPDALSVLSIRRAAPLRLRVRSRSWRPVAACVWGQVSLNPCDAAPPRARYPAPRLRFQPLVLEDLIDHRPHHDGRNGLQLAHQTLNSLLRRPVVRINPHRVAAVGANRELVVPAINGRSRWAASRLISVVAAAFELLMKGNSLQVLTLRGSAPTPAVLFLAGDRRQP